METPLASPQPPGSQPPLSPPPPTEAAVGEPAWPPGAVAGVPRSIQLPRPTPSASPRPLSPRPVAPQPTQERQEDSLAAILELVSRVQAADSVTSSCQTIVNQICRYLNAERVYLGLCGDERGECRVAAVSGRTSFAPRDPGVTAAEGVLQEVLLRDEPACWPPPASEPEAGLLVHEQFVRSQQLGGVLSGPLRDAQGRLAGAWLVVLQQPAAPSDRRAAFLDAASVPVATALELVRRSTAGKWAGRLAALPQLAASRRGRFVIAGVLALLACLFVPVRYRPVCDCALEPVTRRFVAAPFDGPLERSLVALGDEVQAGQLLARMDGREVRWELAGVRADLHRAVKERAGHVAHHELGQAEVARFEVDRLQVRSDLLNHRAANLEIRSPIRGVIVSGDWEEAAGVPLESGETLFEIAPLDKLVAEIAIAEDDFAQIQVGMRAAIRLDAYPLQPLRGTIHAVHPRTELRDDANVFVAEVRIANPGSTLRPGMQGTAQIDARPHPLGWILFRRPFAALVSWLGW